MVHYHPEAILEILARIIGILALLLLIASVRINRRRPSQCQSCGYDRTGLDQTLCPECGKDAPAVITPALAFRPRWLFWGISTLFFYFFLLVQTVPIAEMWYARLPANVCIKTGTIRGLRYRIMTDRLAYPNSVSGMRAPDGTIQRGNAIWAEVYRSGTWEGVFSSQQRLRVDVLAIPDGAGKECDFNGDGVGEVFFVNWSGGAHCCMTTVIFDPKSSTRLAEIKGEHSESFDYIDLDGDKVPEFKVLDWAFAYWNTSFAASPAPEVILSLKGGILHVRTDLMQTPALTDEELRELAQSVAVGPDNQPLSTLWKSMLDLLYGGHSDQANQLLTLAWPDAAPRERFRTEFYNELESSSMWWPLIRQSQSADAP